MRKLLIASLLCILIISIKINLSASTYYVSNAGDDSAAGISPESAWETLAKVSSQSFLPGDSILFKSADLWFEQLTISSSGEKNNEIFFGGYGEGDKPKIFGSKRVQLFSNVTGNIWKTGPFYSDPYEGIYTGGLFFEKDGAVTWGNPKVDYTSNYSNLKKEFDWTWDGNSIYIFSPTDPNTRYDHIDVSQRKYCIYLNNKEHLVFDGLDIRYSTIANMKEAWPFNELSGLEIKNCFSGYTSIPGSGQGFGFECYHSDAHIHHNEITECGRRAMSIYMLDANNGGRMNNILIENNLVYNCYHTGIDFAATFDGATADSIIIRNNYIYEDSTQDITYGGMIHISVIGCSSNETMNDVFIYNNLCVNTTSGCIYISRAENIHVYNNTLYCSNRESTLFGSLMYLTQSSKDCEVKNNIFYQNWQSSWASSNTRACLFAYGLSNFDINYNLYFVTDSTHVYAWNLYANAGGIYMEDWTTYKTAFGWDANSPIPQDPSFTDVIKGDFTLSGNSPAAKAGTPLSIVTTDYNGKPRNPVNPSIGAFEYDPSSFSFETEYEDSGLEIFPNRAKDICTISINSVPNENFTIQIINLHGSKIFQSKMYRGSQKVVIPLLKFESGSYIISKATQVSIAGSKKLIISH